MAYSYQTFTFGQVLTAAQMQQVEINIRDHVHGTSSVVRIPADGVNSGLGWRQELASTVVTSASPVSAVAFTSSFSSAVYQYRVHLLNVVVNSTGAAPALQLQFTTDGGTTWAGSNYNSCLMLAEPTSGDTSGNVTYLGHSGAGANGIRIAQSIYSNAPGDGVNAVIDIPNPVSSAFHTAYGWSVCRAIPGGNSVRHNKISGLYLASQAQINGVRITPAANATQILSGTIKFEAFRVSA